MICPSCGAENRAEARFCDACGAPLAAAVARPREQRKVVTVLFCDVAGSTALGERLDPEAMRTMMARYFDVARAAIERHGGTVEKFIGDAVMAVFGVPVVREDDALRAVRAAAELRDGVEIDVRIGVNTGEVVTGSGDTLVTGDAVNVAARLEQAAASGEVLLGAETLRLVRDAVEVEASEPIQAKGKAEPVPAYRLLAVTGDVAVARRGDAPLVGRDRERRMLADAWDRVTSERSCSLFTVLGPAGVGKSRLVHEFLADLDATVVRGRCLSYGDGITYWPVVEAVLQLLDGAPPPEGPVAALLGDGQAQVGDIAFSVRKLFEAKAAERPLVVLFDDLHWGEAAFLDLIEHVADWSRDAPILLLCLARAELLERRSGWGGGKLNATTVLLESLSDRETDELIDGLLGGSGIDDALRGRIRDAAEGNPLFVEQMLAMVEESPTADVTVPPTIQALLAARLDQLPMKERSALERGAVEGQVFHRGAVVALAPGDPDVPSHLLGLVRKELVRPSTTMFAGDDAFRFRHLLIRDAAYDALPKAERAELHQRFAAWVEERGADLVELDEILGYHLGQAARYRTELGTPSPELSARAADRLGAAGRRAEARGDNGAALALIERAVELLDGDAPERVVLLPDLGRVLYAAGRLAESDRAFTEAIERGDPATAASGFFFRTFARGHGGAGDGAEIVPYSELVREVRDAIRALPPGTGDFTYAQGYSVLANLLFWDGDLEGQLEAGRLCAEHARRSGHAQLEMIGLRLVGGGLGNGPTPWPDVLRFVDEVEREAGRLGSGAVDHARYWRAYAARGVGSFDEATELLTANRADLEERGMQLSVYTGATNRAYVRLAAGDLEGGERDAREAWEALGAMGERGFRSTIGAMLGIVLARQGRSDEARAVAAEAEALAPPDDHLTTALAAWARAVAALADGEPAVAVEHARNARVAARRIGYNAVEIDACLVLGEALRAAGETDEARDALTEALGLAEAKGSTFFAGVAREQLAALPAAG